MKIAFTDVDVSHDGWIRCNVTREVTEEFYIQLPYSYQPAPDLIAAVFASLCGDTFKEVTIDLPLGADQVVLFEENLKAKIHHRPGVATRRRPGRNNGLNFSGGFDSLAAMEILGNPHLISLDFGGRFSRERDFFERFQPLIFHTNLTELGLNRYSWQFMGLGSILLRDELDLASYSFGSILAGALPRLFSRPLDQSTSGIPAANALGMVQRNPVAGISEIGALSLVVRKHPELLLDALMSVALPQEGKFQRKYQMLEAVTKSSGLSIRMPEISNRYKKFKWGASFPDDLSALYVIKQMGEEYVSSSYIDGIPKSVVIALNKIDVSFLEKFNPQAYEGVPDAEFARWQFQMVNNGFRPYYRNDWHEIKKVLELLDSE